MLGPPPPVHFCLFFKDPRPYLFFGTSPVTSTEVLNLKYLKTGLFLSLLSVIF